MISSRVSAAALAVFVSAGLASGALAQSAPAPASPTTPATQLEPSTLEPLTPIETPRPLAAPVSAPRQLTAPRRLVPQAQPEPSAASAAPVGVPSDVRRTTGIQVDSLTAVDNESVGALRSQDGGLGAAMWQGTRRTDAIRLIEGLPAPISSPALRDVAVRLLLSRAKAPVAVAENAPSLLAARAEKLLALGDVENTELLLSVAPSQGRPAELDQVDAMIQVLRYNNPRACGLARNNRAAATSDFWQRLLIYCDGLDGKASNVQLGVTMLRETSGDDPALALLMDSLISRSPVTLESVDNPKPIHLAISRAANVELPVSIASSDDPLVLFGTALATNVPLGGRIDAAERAVMLGVLNPLELRRLYTQVPFEAVDLENALTRADEIGGPAARALLYQAAVRQNIPAARGEIITAAYIISREDNRYMAALQGFRPLMDRVPPSPEMAWFALTGVRAYIALGDQIGTNKWLTLLRASATLNEDAKLALDRVRPLARMLGAGPSAEPLGDVLRAWNETIREQPELQPIRTLMNGLFMALGEALPEDAWQGVPKFGAVPQPMPEPSVWFQFRERMDRFKPGTGGTEFRVAGNAAGLNRNLQAGEGQAAATAVPTILALQSMGSGPPSSRGPAVLFELVRALRTLGFVEASRQLAVESMLDAGL